MQTPSVTLLLSSLATARPGSVTDITQRMNSSHGGLPLLSLACRRYRPVFPRHWEPDLELAASRPFQRRR
eukprot:1474239-Rhodomonas_salina.1